MFGVHNRFEELERHLREPAAAERRAEQAPHPLLSEERVRRSDS
jgi:hypothetical protein